WCAAERISSAFSTPTRWFAACLRCIPTTRPSESCRGDNIRSDRMKGQKEKVELEKLVSFQLGGDVFAAEVLAVERVLRYTTPNTVPDVPDWIEGVIEHGDGVIPVVDM